MIFLDTPLEKINPILEEPPDLSKYMRDIESHWAEVIKQLPHAWNGEHLSCKKVEIENNRINLYLCRIDYKTHLWAKKINLYSPGTNLIGVGTIGFDPEARTFILGERSNSK